MSDSPDPELASRRLGRRLLTLCGALALAAMAVRGLVSGIGAELSEPQANAIIDGLLIAVGLCALAARFLMTPRARPALERFDLAPDGGLAGAGALAALALILGVPWAVVPDIAWRTALSGGATLALFAGLLRWLERPADARRALAWPLAYGLLLAGLAAYEVVVEFPQSVALVESGEGIPPGLSPEQRDEFLARVRSQAASGPFLIANLLGGAFVLLWPLALAAGLRAWGRGRKGMALSCGGIALACGLGMALTKAKGIAPASLAAAWLLLLLWPERAVEADEGEALEDAKRAAARARRRRRGALLGVALVGLGLASFGLWRFARDPEAFGFGLSLKVRLEYWRAGLGMLSDRPALGAGLNNYRSLYTLYKPARSEETRFAHNNLIQLLADGGLIGVALLLAALAWLAWELARAPASGAAVESEPRGPPDDGAALGPRVWLLGGLVGMLALWAVPGRYQDAGLGFRLALAAAFLLAWRLGEALAADEDPRGDAILRAGVLAGLGGWLAHGLFDFSLHCHGLLMLAAALAAFGRRLRGPRSPAPAPLRALWWVFAALAAAALALWLPAIRRAGELTSSGREALTQAYLLREAEPEAAAALLEGAIAELEAACAAHPSRASWHALASAYESRFALGGVRARRAEDLLAARAAYARALEADPFAADIAIQAADALSRARAAGFEAPAEEELALVARAAQSYPTQPRIRFRYAGLLRARGDPAALDEYAAALVAHRDARLKRVQLTEAQLAEARRELEAAGRAPPAAERESG